VAVVTVLLVAALCAPQAGGRFFGAVESFGSRLARKKSLAIIWVTAAGIFLRVAMLPQVPVPNPEFHDEFSYLLAADTFAHGRLTNPPHPMRIYFDTMHVNQLPAYMSKYPPAQGAALALGQVLGHPWIGVLLSVAAMIAAVVWALQGWLPPPWALLGGVLLVLRVGIFGYWINSYWGGAAAALGGALVIGALPRIMRAGRPRDAVILGLGVAILANSRPFEGLIFSAPAVAVLLFWLFRKQSPSWRQTLPRVVAPVCAVILLCGAFMAYYNWRGTGNPLLFPYTLNERAYESATPALLWQKAMPPVHYANAQFDVFYNDLNHETWRAGRANSIGKAIRLLGRDAGRFVRFLLWPELCVPFLLLFCILCDRRVRFLVAQTAICFFGFVLVAWFFSHYAAPLVATVFALTMQGFRHLRRVTWRGRPIGVGVSRAVVIAAVLLAPFHPMDYPKAGVANRARIAKELERMPGKRLVIVRYSPNHNAGAEWVYNRADIDDSKVVWARDIPGVDIAPLLAYYRDRRAWIVEPDSSSPEPRAFAAPLKQ
jgi:hypothetical protein